MNGLIKIHLTFCFHDRKQEVVGLMSSITRQVHKCLTRTSARSSSSAHGLLFGAAFAVVTAGIDGVRMRESRDCRCQERRGGGPTPAAPSRGPTWPAPGAGRGHEAPARAGENNNNHLFLSYSHFVFESTGVAQQEARAKS